MPSWGHAASAPGPFPRRPRSSRAESEIEVKNNLAIFLVNAYGGDRTAYKYEGADMKTAHAGLKITAAQYEAFLGKVVVPALQTNGVAQEDIDKCFAPPLLDAAFKAAIIAE